MLLYIYSSKTDILHGENSTNFDVQQTIIHLHLLGQSSNYSRLRTIAIF